MDKPPLALDPNFSGASEDFPALLRRKGLLQIAPEPTGAAGGHTFIPTESTTILAFKFAGGVLVAGDRRATAGNTVVYDRADKVLEIDRHSIIRSEEHTSELQSLTNLVCRLLLEKKKTQED